jgi:hypothetical protein
MPRTADSHTGLITLHPSVIVEVGVALQPIALVKQQHK